MQSHGAGGGHTDAGAAAAAAPTWPRWALALLWLLAAGGGGLIVRRLLQHHFLFIDEVSIGACVAGRSWAGLFEPLDHGQMAPPGFLVAVKALTAWLGPSELSLRLTAAVAGIAALLVMPLLVRRVLAPVGGLAVMAALALNGVLIHYATQAKQYTLELLFATLLLTLAVRLLQSPRPRRWLAAWTATAVVGVWFAYALVFVIAGVGLVLIAQAAWERRWGAAAERAAACALAAASFLPLALLTMRPDAGDAAKMAYMHTYWRASFARPADVLGQVALLARLFENPGDLAIWAGGLLLALAVVGLGRGARPRPWIAPLLAAPVAVALLAAVLRVYPLGDRLALYLLPCLAALAATGAAALWAWGNPAARALVVIAAVAVFTPLIRQRGSPPCDNAHPALAAARAQMQPGGTVYIYYGLRRAILYYDQIGRPVLPPDLHRIYGSRGREDWDVFQRDIDALPRSPRVWVLFNHVHANSGADEHLLLTHTLDRLGVRRFEFAQGRCFVYLYDLTTPPPPGAATVANPS